MVLLQPRGAERLPEQAALGFVLDHGHGNVNRHQRHPGQRGDGVVGQHSVALPDVAEPGPERRHRPPAEDARGVHRHGRLHVRGAPCGAGAGVARTVAHQDDVGAQHLACGQQPGEGAHGLQIAAERLAGRDHAVEQVGATKRIDQSRERAGERCARGHHIDDGGGTGGPGAGGCRPEHRVQREPHHRRAVQSFAGAITVRAARFLDDGYVDLLGRVAELHDPTAG